MKDDEDEAVELKDRLAVYNFNDSPPEHSGNTHVLCTAKYSYLLQNFKLITYNVMFVQPLRLRLQKDSRKERKGRTIQAKEAWQTRPRHP